ncbi:hypothetical protein D3C76_1272770 [compost metagenome]
MHRYGGRHEERQYAGAVVVAADFPIRGVSGNHALGGADNGAGLGIPGHPEFAQVDAVADRAARPLPGATWNGVGLR